MAGSLRGKSAPRSKATLRDEEVVATPARNRRDFLLLAGASMIGTGSLSGCANSDLDPYDGFGSGRRAGYSSVGSDPDPSDPYGRPRGRSGPGDPVGSPTRRLNSDANPYDPPGRASQPYTGCSDGDPSDAWHHGRCR